MVIGIWNTSTLKFMPFMKIGTDYCDEPELLTLLKGKKLSEVKDILDIAFIIARESQTL